MELYKIFEKFDLWSFVDETGRVLVGLSLKWKKSLDNIFEGGFLAQKKNRVQMKGANLGSKAGISVYSSCATNQCGGVSGKHG